jgi:hypothetical protein
MPIEDRAAHGDCEISFNQSLRIEEAQEAAQTVSHSMLGQLASTPGSARQGRHRCRIQPGDASYSGSHRLSATRETLSRRAHSSAASPRRIRAVPSTSARSSCIPDDGMLRFHLGQVFRAATAHVPAAGSVGSDSRGGNAIERRFEDAVRACAGTRQAAIPRRT